MPTVYIKLAKSVSKSKVLPDKESDLTNSLKFIKECMKKQLTESNNDQINDPSQITECDIEIDTSNAWKSIISPLIAFETEYDMKVTKKDTNEVISTFMYAQVTNKSSGEDSSLLTCNPQKEF